MSSPDALTSPSARGKRLYRLGGLGISIILGGLVYTNSGKKVIDQPLPQSIVPTDTTLNMSQEERMRAIIVNNEKNKVRQWFASYNTIILGDPIILGTISLSKEDIYPALDVYQGLSIDRITQNGGRKGYMDFIKPSLPGLEKVVQQLGIDKLPNLDSKVEAIIDLIKIREHSMVYSHDTLTIDKQLDTSCYVRPPIIALADGLQYNGSPSDCEDYATIFIGLCLASGIPEENLFILIRRDGPEGGHMLAGISGTRKESTYGYFTRRNGKKIIPIEPQPGLIGYSSVDAANVYGKE